MKRLISLISSEGKTAKEIAQETWKAWQKYQKVSKESDFEPKTNLDANKYIQLCTDD